MLPKISKKGLLINVRPIFVLYIIFKPKTKLASYCENEAVSFIDYEKFCSVKPKAP